jgi:RNA polymerase sigma factor (sigma-70 family)
MRATLDQKADGELISRLDARYRGPLMSFFLRRVGNRTEAEDLTQDVFLHLLGAGDPDRIRNADAFVFRIASNLLRDRGRRSAARGSVLPAGVDGHLVNELAREFLEDRDPERALIAREQIASVFQALDELEERTKDIYVLFRLEAMKQREIATLFGLTVKSVEKHVMRATLHLALRLGPRQR